LVLIIFAAVAAISTNIEQRNPILGNRGMLWSSPSVSLLSADGTGVTLNGVVLAGTAKGFSGGFATLGGPGSASGGFYLPGRLPVYDQNPAYVLYCLGATSGAYFPKNPVTLPAIRPKHSDLDEFVAFQGAFDFSHDTCRQALLADHHHGMQQIGLGAQCTSLCRIYRFHSIILSAGSSGLPLGHMSKSKNWMQQHVNDPYVIQARDRGYRSRAAFKLLELLDKEALNIKGQAVVDLGATPGSWSQVLAERVGLAGKVIALDVLEMEPLSGVEFIQGDFREESVLAQLEKSLAGAPLSLVVSDMAPNLSGVASSDQVRGIHLCELAVDFACNHMKKNGIFITKVFQGVGFPEFQQDMKRRFNVVVSRKPKASRGRSSELYLVGRGLK
jgi:23S rRNA (uridine2552-2'-O)-methyltransferase